MQRLRVLVQDYRGDFVFLTQATLSQTPCSLAKRNLLKT
jgi:hypothetical protein